VASHLFSVCFLGAWKNMAKRKYKKNRYGSMEERLNKLVNNFRLQENRELVRQWVDERVTNGVDQENVCRILYSLHRAIDGLDKPIRQIIKKNDRDAIVKHLKNIAVDGKIVRKHKILLKRFFKWVNDGEHPRCTKWISTRKTLDDMKPEIQLLSDDEKQAILDNAVWQRDRAIFMIFLENPTRPRDIINLNVGDVVPNEYGYEIRFHSKTQRGFRNVQFIHSAPELRLYLSSHRWRDNSDAPLFYSFSNRDKDKSKPQRLKYTGIDVALKEACKRAGIKRHLTLYHFRKTVTSELLQDPRYTPKEVQVLGGWSNISTMFDTYGKVTSDMVNQKKLKISGKIPADDAGTVEKPLTPVKCPRCGTENPKKVDTCINCWLPLNKQGAVMNARHTVSSLAKYEGVDKDDKTALLGLVQNLFQKGVLDPNDFV
jgi:integrase